MDCIRGAGMRDKFDEMNTTLEYMAKRGVQQVRGGGPWITVKLSASQEQIIEQSVYDLCYNCRASDHILADCPDEKMSLKKVIIRKLTSLSAKHTSWNPDGISSLLILLDEFGSLNNFEEREELFRRLSGYDSPSALLETLHLRPTTPLTNIHESSVQHSPWTALFDLPKVPSEDTHARMTQHLQLLHLKQSLGLNQIPWNPEGIDSILDILSRYNLEPRNCSAVRANLIAHSPSTLLAHLGVEGYLHHSASTAQGNELFPEYPRLIHTQDLPSFCRWVDNLGRSASEITKRLHALISSNFTNTTSNAPFQQQLAQRMNVTAGSNYVRKPIKVTVMGTTGVGKSAFINFLLALPLLPSYDTKCTALTTVISYGEHPRYRLKPLDGIPGDPHPWIEIDLANGPSFGYHDHDQSFLPTVGRDPITMALDQSFLHFYMEVEWPHPLLQTGIVITDSPGFEEDETQLARQYFFGPDQTHAIILLFDLASKAFKSWEDRRLKFLLSMGTDPPDKFFFVGTFILTSIERYPKVQVELIETVKSIKTGFREILQFMNPLISSASRDFADKIRQPKSSYFAALSSETDRIIRAQQLKRSLVSMSKDEFNGFLDELASLILETLLDQLSVFMRPYLRLFQQQCQSCVQERTMSHSLVSNLSFMPPILQNLTHGPWMIYKGIIVQANQGFFRGLWRKMFTTSRITLARMSEPNWIDNYILSVVAGVDPKDFERLIDESLANMTKAYYSLINDQRLFLQDCAKAVTNSSQFPPAIPPPLFSGSSTNTTPFLSGAFSTSVPPSIPFSSGPYSSELSSSIRFTSGSYSSELPSSIPSSSGSYSSKLLSSIPSSSGSYSSKLPSSGTFTPFSSYSLPPSLLPMGIELPQSQTVVNHLSSDDTLCSLGTELFSILSLLDRSSFVNTDPQDTMSSIIYGEYRSSSSLLYHDISMKAVLKRFSGERGTLQLLRELRGIFLQRVLTHKNILPPLACYYDMHSIEPCHFIVLPRMPDSLEKWSARATTEELGFFSHRTSLARALKLAQTLNYIHLNGFIHRSVQPSNILLDKDSQPLFTDFGVSIFDRAERQLLDENEGYVAPEVQQNQEGSYDFRVDIYSLGVTFFVLETGIFPSSQILETFTNDYPGNEFLQLIQDMICPLNRRIPTMAHVCQRLLTLFYSYSLPSLDTGINILTLDGGGMRGLIEIEIMIEIERITKRPIHQTFHLIGGTSTGGILSIAVGKFHIPLATLRDLYLSLGPKVFGRARIIRVLSAITTGASFSGQVLRSLLAKYIEPDISLQDDSALPRVFVTSTQVRKDPDLITRTVLFRSYIADVPDNPPLESSVKPNGPSGTSALDAAIATGSAPTYFPAIALPINSREPLHFVDGGLRANNPSAIAIHEATLLWPGIPINLFVSLGTGSLPPEWTDEKKPKYRRASILNWAVESVNIATDSETTHQHVRELLANRSSDCYLRFNPPGCGNIDLSESNQDILNDVRARTIFYLQSTQEGGHLLQKICEKLGVSWTPLIPDALSNSAAVEYTSVVPFPYWKGWPDAAVEVENQLQWNAAIHRRDSQLFDPERQQDRSLSHYDSLFDLFSSFLARSSAYREGHFTFQDTPNSIATKLCTATYGYLNQSELIDLILAGFLLILRVFCP